LSRVYFIRDAQGERQLGEHELPLPVGGVQHGGIVLPELPDADVVAYIGLAEGHAFVQPAQTNVQLFHNYEHVTASKWLKSGDVIEVAGSLIHWNVQGDQVEIDVRQRMASPVLEPPSSPPPVNNRTLPEVPQAPAAVRNRRFVRPLLLAAFVLLLIAVAFVLLATPVSVQIMPEPQRQSLEGFPPAIPFGGRQLVLPGRYTVVADEPGYYPLQQPIVVPSGGFQVFEFQLEELPGQVSISLQPDVSFRLFVNDVALAIGARGPAEIAAGAQRLRIETDRYLPVEATLEVLGKGQAQQVNYVLQPAWANVRVDSQPKGASILIDGETIGQTPLQTEILQGERELVLELENHKALSLRQQIQAGADVTLGPFQLQTLDGRLIVSSVPDEASLSVDGVFHGTTPLTLPLTSGVEHELRLSKPGYERFDQKVTLGPDEEQSIEARLQSQYGIVFVTAQPADARLRVDGKDVGKATQRLQLTTRNHRLEFSKKGYVSKTINVTPRAGGSKNVDVTLASVADTGVRKQGPATPPTVKIIPGGQKLHLVRPQGSFRMGASRREPGRRANETARQVKLVRPFYLSGTEVTNAQYRKFKPAHSSGFAEGQSLDADDQPVVGVSWEDAAGYCNWLSGREGLPPAYKEVNGRLQPVLPMTSGYRLPSEAEWAYVARRYGQQSEQRYPWKGSFPPVSVAGNFADASIADTLANTVPDYNDGYRAAAPVGSFSARPAGFHDLGGNVAEWVHDFYAVYPGEANKLVSDPLGPESGDHHVVRDSSWRQGTITELRLSYRDYSRAARPDLGFRVARYAK